MNRLFFTSFLVLAAVGCAQTDPVLNRPIVDMTGVNPQVYEADLADCTGFANEVSTGTNVLVASASGALIGGVTGAIWRHDADYAARSAGVGAVWGGAGGVASSVNERGRVLKNCLRNRGYAVLN